MKRCDWCKVFVDHTSSFECFARQYFTCTSPYMIYLAYCTKFGNYGAGSTENRKPRIFNYKAHMKKVKSRLIVKHSIDFCTDTVNPIMHSRLILIDCVTNTEKSSKEEIDDLLLEKENF